jgi:hypothetical protein
LNRAVDGAVCRHALADITRDGIIDLAAANGGANTAIVSAGDGTGRFTLISTLPTRPGPTGIACGDAHGDARIDLALAHPRTQDGTGITLYPGKDPAGTFGPGVGLYTDTPILLVLFSGQDILGLSGNTLSVLEHTGGNFYGPPEDFVLPVAVASEPALADPEDVERIRDRSEKGFFCAVGRFEHLGGPAVQRFASLLTILVTLSGLGVLGRRERRRSGSPATRSTERAS